MNLLKPPDESYIQPKFEYHEVGSRRRFFRKLFFYPMVFLVIFSFLFVGNAIFSNESFFANIRKLNVFGQIPEIISSDTSKLKGYNDDRINILLLGMGGKGHAGPFLTDTIILASYQPSTKKMAMLSIPRDLLVEIPNRGWKKINNVNAFAEIDESGSGGEATKNTISQIFDIPIHYYVRIDFAGFKELVDDLGGVNVYVERSFSDSSYPTDDYGYQTVSFEHGWQQMDSETALQYSRSRHGNNGEGSDFARALRQQKVIFALREKILSANTLFNPKKLNTLLGAYNNKVQTNIDIWEAVAFKKIAEEFNGQIINQILDSSPDNYLYNNIVGGAYVLQPKAGDWSGLQYLADNIFDPELTAKEKANIEILNGTVSTGLAYRTGLVFQYFGYDITRMRNAVENDYKKTIIYDLSNGSKKRTLNGLKRQLRARVSVEIPDWIEEWQGDDWAGEDKIFTKADIVIVVGSDIKYWVNKQVNILNLVKESDQELIEITQEDIDETKREVVESGEGIAG